MALFLFLVLAAIVLGLVGVVTGLSYLLAIGILVLVADLLLFGVRWSRHSHEHPAR
jgi:hypothetical protein